MRSATPAATQPTATQRPRAGAGRGGDEVGRRRHDGRERQRSSPRRRPRPPTTAALHAAASSAARRRRRSARPRTRSPLRHRVRNASPTISEPTRDRPGDGDEIAPLLRHPRRARRSTASAAATPNAAIAWRAGSAAVDRPDRTEQRSRSRSRCRSRRPSRRTRAAARGGAGRAGRATAAVTAYGNGAPCCITHHEPLAAEQRDRAERPHDRREIAMTGNPEDARRERDEDERRHEEPPADPGRVEHVAGR